jgi:anti-sigma-K factor RskA
MNSKWGALLFGLGLVLVTYLGGKWFGRWFRISVVALVIVAYGVTLFMVRRRKTQLVRQLANADRETQDPVLAELDADDRREVLRRLGCNDA